MKNPTFPPIENPIESKTELQKLCIDSVLELQQSCIVRSIQYQAGNALLRSQVDRAPYSDLAFHFVDELNHKITAAQMEFLNNEIENLKSDTYITNFEFKENNHED